VECVIRNLGSYIKDRRDALGIRTQLDLARLSGVPPTTVNRIEKGVTQLPDADIRRKLARALGVTHVDILIAAGQITAEEIPAQIVSPSADRLIREEKGEAEIVRMVRALPDDLARIVFTVADGLYKREQREQKD